MEPAKKYTSLRISITAKRLIVELTKKLGVNKGAVLELAIREKAKREEVE